MLVVVTALLSPKQPHAFFFLFKLLASAGLGGVQWVLVCSGSFYEPLPPLLSGTERAVMGCGPTALRLGMFSRNIGKFFK